MWKLIFIFALVASLGSVSAAAGADLRTGQSRFYNVHTALGKDQTRTFGRHMDKVYAEYRRRFSHLRPRKTGRLSLYLFKTSDNYKRFLRLHGVNGANSGGMFVIRPNMHGLATWVRGRNRSETFSTLQHEGFHQFAWKYFGDKPPPWVNEGLAQYFEDGIVTGRKMKLGLVNPRRLRTVRQAIRENQAVDIERVLTINGSQWHRTLSTDPDRAGLFYAQAWSMVYFLVHGEHGKYRHAFDQYLKLISSGRPSKAAFQRAFGTDDLSVMDNKWRAYIKTVKPDPLSAALADLKFLGAGMEWLDKHGAAMPTTLDELKQALQGRGFYLTRSSHGMTRKLKASDSARFTYQKTEKQTGDYKLLKSSENQLPPRITAPGLSPTPTLTWTRAENGELTSRMSLR